MNEFEAHESSYDHQHKKVFHCPSGTFVSLSEGVLMASIAPQGDEADAA